MISSTRFLRRVWGSQPRDGFVFLTWFDDDHDWHDTQFTWPLDPSTGLHLPNDRQDVYFAPNIFASQLKGGTAKRRREHALPGIWLYADLDEVDPSSLDALPPTAAWETSPSRYQCLWRLTRPLAPATLAALNQRVTYFTGADKAGWKLSQVLRVPGSTSTKHDAAPHWRIPLLWWDAARSYSAAAVLEAVKSVPKGLQPPGQRSTHPKLPKVTASRILRRRKVPARALKLYKAKQPRGDRSARLWELENLLLKAGCTPEETVVVVQATVWNKYAGQRREISQLWNEVQKAASLISSSSSRPPTRERTKSTSRSTASKQTKSSRSRSKTKPPKEKPSETQSDTQPKQATSYNEFLGQRLKRPGWLVEGIWSEQAHGVLAGEAKAYKSVISTDLAVSVASGTPFLGHFSIPATGAVLMIQEENDEGETQDRLRRIAHSRQLVGSAELTSDNGRSPTHLKITPDAELPLHLLNNESFDLTNADDLRWLVKEIQKHSIKLVTLDPFYLMTPGIDENSAHQVSPVLLRLLKIKQKLDCGILLIHHYKKQNVMNPIYGAARMSGTGVFHRWFESAVYVEKDQKQGDVVRLVPDHRGHRAMTPIRVRFDLGTDADLYYMAHVKNVKADSVILNERLEDLLSERADKEEKERWTIAELRVAMGLSSSRTLKYMLKDHDYKLKTVKSGGRGRPRQVVVPNRSRQ